MARIKLTEGREDAPVVSHPYSRAYGSGQDPSLAFLSMPGWFRVNYTCFCLPCSPFLPIP